jgi:hypothetical protein
MSCKVVSVAAKKVYKIVQCRERRCKKVYKVVKVDANHR